MKELLVLNPENVTAEEISTFRVRRASRAVVIDMRGKIALINVSEHNYYKLPGGGLKGDEDAVTALKRECKEEIGCDVEVVAELGTIVEYRKISELNQTSYCYLAKMVGEGGATDLTESEIKRGFKTAWLSYDNAMQALEESTATSIQGALYIVPRDIAILKEVKSFF